MKDTEILLYFAHMYVFIPRYLVLSISVYETSVGAFK